MSNLTVIMGLCGSGKTHILMDLIGKSSMGAYVKDEGFLNENFESNYEYLKTSLKSGINSILVGGEFCYQNNQQILEKKVRTDFPEINIKWIAFENNLAKANANVRNRKNKSDAEGHIRINNELTKHYHIPEGSQLIKITEI